MAKTTQLEEYTLAISESIFSLFKDEDDGGNPNYHYDLNKIDATKFFTAMIMACGYIYNRLTQDDKTFLDFTYLANQLIVQNLLEKEGK